MRVLIEEDDFLDRRVFQIFLSPYGTYDIAVNGNEAVEAFKMTLNENKPYDLICLDIMMPARSSQENQMVHVLLDVFACR